MRSAAPPHGLAATPSFGFVPVVAPLLARRHWSAGVTVVAFLQLLAVQFGYPALGCPIHDFTGVPCPGCGLTSAILHFCRGEWAAGFASHAFAPAFMLGIVACFVAAVAPADRRDRAVQKIEAYERRTGIMGAAGIALVLYWAVRVMVAP